MNASFSKELRTLTWPTAAIVAVIVLPMAWVSMFEPESVPRDLRALWMSAFQVSAVGFLLGSALLAALPFGAEFQHRTMVLLMAQPVSRGRIWLIKHAALVAVLSVIGVAGYFAVGSRSLDGYPLAQATFLLLLLCSSAFWTLVAGSTIGGAVFGPAGMAMVELASSFVVSRMTGLELDPFDAHPALVATRLAYGGLMLWLGWRMFARYELRGQGEGGIAVATGLTERLPALRARPTGAIANLVRKEIWLQQPTFLIAALLTGVWLAAMLFFAMPPARPQVANVIFTVLLIGYYPLVSLVCGTISVGEDTSLGVRGWHLTLPVSSFKQWAVKLGVTLGVGAVLVLALPLVLTAILPFFVALPAGEIQLPSTWRTAVALGSLLVISFWSATLFGQTVKAAIAVGVAMFGLWLFVLFAGLAGQRFRLGGEWLTSLMVANQWSPDDLLLTFVGSRQRGDLGILVSLAVLGIVALRQSLTAFRTTQAGWRQIARGAAVLALIAMVASFVPSAYLKAAGDTYRSQPVRELEAALQRVSYASLEASGRIPESVELSELEATGLLSEDTRRWLTGTRIALQPTATFYRSGGDGRRYVLAKIHRSSGMWFSTFYSLPTQPAR